MSLCASILDVSVQRTKDAGSSKASPLYPLATERDPNAVRNWIGIHRTDVRGGVDPWALGPRRSAIQIHSRRVRKREAVGTERVPVDLAQVEVDKVRCRSILELQDGLVDFAGDGTDLDGDAVVVRGVRGRVGAAVGTHVDDGAAGTLVANIEVDFEAALVKDGGGSDGCLGVDDVCFAAAYGEGRNGWSGGYGCGASG